MGHKQHGKDTKSKAADPLDKARSAAHQNQKDHLRHIDHNQYLLHLFRSYFYAIPSADICKLFFSAGSAIMAAKTKEGSR